MSKGLIYLIAIFALWMYFSFSKDTVSDFDNAGSGHGGTLVNNDGNRGGFGNRLETTPVTSQNSTNSNRMDFSSTIGLMKDEKGVYYMKDGTKVYVPMT